MEAFHPTGGSCQVGVPWRGERKEQSKAPAAFAWGLWHIVKAQGVAAA